jgi:hypothetical protein
MTYLEAIGVLEPGMATHDRLKVVEGQVIDATFEHVDEGEWEPVAGVMNNPPEGAWNLAEVFTWMQMEDVCNPAWLAGEWVQVPMGMMHKSLEGLQHVEAALVVNDPNGLLR